MYEIVYKIIGICIVSSIAVLTVKNIVPSFVPVLALTCGAVCWYLILPYMSRVISLIEKVSHSTQSVSDYFAIILKIIGISILCQFSCEMCDDMGESYLSSKIEFAGKTIILCMCLPEFLDLINTIVGMINLL